MFYRNFECFLLVFRSVIAIFALGEKIPGEICVYLLLKRVYSNMLSLKTVCLAVNRSKN
jgi:hypothetical protein